eukprot:TRINITY_DN2683_c0_g1_i1.p1 TRINITY_DN2683_c0_g1~~TRINITY_DN2683_c0_g1_i1.p1  ORF type:complete len:517 (-),score=153.79 TRINITY_DN2683_c0_g1_i1:230-1780(-)
MGNKGSKGKGKKESKQQKADRKAAEKAAKRAGKDAGSDGRKLEQARKGGKGSKTPGVDEFRVRFAVGKRIGVGRFSTVHVCVEKKSGRPFSVKIIPKKQHGGRFTSGFQREARVLSRLDHPSIVHLEETIETDDVIYIVTELHWGGDLMQRLMQQGPASEDDARELVRSLLECLVYLHGKGILHRDIKPENILLARKDSMRDIKLCDFGHAADGDDEAGGYGTPDYLAPEVVVDNITSEKSDIWSVGVVTYILMSCTFPFCSTDAKRMMKEIVAGKYSLSGKTWPVGVVTYILMSCTFPFCSTDAKRMMKEIVAGKYSLSGKIWESKSEAVKDFVQYLMTTDPDERPSAKEALNHPFLKNSELRERKAGKHGKYQSHGRRNDGPRRRGSGSSAGSLSPRFDDFSEGSLSDDYSGSRRGDDRKGRLLKRGEDKRGDMSKYKDVYDENYERPRSVSEDSFGLESGRSGYSSYGSRSRSRSRRSGSYSGSRSRSRSGSRSYGSGSGSRSRGGDYSSYSR